MVPLREPNGANGVSGRVQDTNSANTAGNYNYARFNGLTPSGNTLAFSLSGGNNCDACATTPRKSPSGTCRPVPEARWMNDPNACFFADGGRQTVARVMAAPVGDLGIAAFTDGSCAVEAWKLKSIW